MNFISAFVGCMLTSIESGDKSIKSTKKGNLLTVENDLNAFSTAATIVLFFIHLLLTNILSLFLEPLAIISLPI